MWIFELFSLVSPHLKRLVLDFPFDSLKIESDHLGVYRYLRDGLLRLANLEELVSMNNDLNLQEHWAIKNPNYWWLHSPKLKRVAVPTPHLPHWGPISARIVRNSPANLEQLVMRMRFPTNDSAGVRYKLDLFAKPGRGTPLKLVQVHNGIVAQTERRNLFQFGIENQERVELHSIVVPAIHGEPTADTKGLIDFVLRAAIEGTLWTMENTIEHHGPHIELHMDIPGWD
jgi:hypothetical protein